MKTCLFVFVDDQNSACAVFNHAQLKCSIKKTGGAVFTLDR